MTKKLLMFFRVNLIFCLAGSAVAQVLIITSKENKSLIASIFVSILSVIGPAVAVLAWQNFTRNYIMAEGMREAQAALQRAIDRAEGKDDEKKDDPDKDIVSSK